MGQLGFRAAVLVAPDGVLLPAVPPSGYGRGLLVILTTVWAVALAAGAVRAVRDRRRRAA